MNLKELRALAEAATSGAWAYEEGCADAVFSEDADETVVGESVTGLWLEPNNGAHIAAFDPPTVLALIDVAEAAETELKNIDLSSPLFDAFNRLRRVGQ